MAIEVRPLHPLFGAEVIGVQVCAPISDADFAVVRAAFEEHSVLAFRGQELHDAGHIAFSKRFGPLETTVKGNPAAGSNFARQSNVDINSGEVIPPEDKRLSYLKAARLWHTDSSFKPVPALCSLLAGHVIPPEGGNTEFATGRPAWDELAEPLKRRIRGRFAMHSQMHTLSLVASEVITEEMREEIKPVDQPMVRVNPVNGRKNIYLGMHAFRVLDMDDDAGRALIAEINAHLTQPRYVYSHRWQTGDLVMWDNRAVLHRATPYDSVKYKRMLQRTTVAGDAAAYQREREMHALAA
jgi:alpha-ketoglutarate-dependent 2,4-dichlorophenoxyacetate dioxygenase